MIQDNAIIFHSKVDMAKILIRNIESLGKDTQDFNQILDELIFEVDKNIANININEIEKSARKMVIDGIYLEAIKKIEKIITSLNNYSVYFRTMSSCEYINKLEKIDDKELSLVIENLISCLNEIRSSETVYFKDEESAIRLLYKTVYKVIKLEYLNNPNKSSKLFSYVNNYQIDKIFISKLIISEIDKLKQDGEDIAKIELILHKMNSSFSEDLYFNEELIKELAYFKENSLLENKTREEIMKISEEYTKNSTQIESTKHKINEINKDVDNNKKELNDYKKELNKSITKRILSFILIASLTVAPFGGLYFLVRTKKTKNITTSYNITSMSDGDFSSEYEDASASIANDRLYVKVSNPYVKDLKGYYQDYWTYDLNYEDYDEMPLEDIAKNLDIEKIYASLSETERQTLYKESLNYEDLIGETTYELVKIDNIPEDYKYVIGFENVFMVIIVGLVVSVTIYELLDFAYDGFIDWFEMNKEDKDEYKDYIDGYKDYIQELLANKEELIKKMYYLLDTNAEIKKRYEEMMKDPAIMEIVSKIGNSIDLSLMNEEEKISKGKKRVLEK